MSAKNALPSHGSTLKSMLADEFMEITNASIDSVKHDPKTGEYHYTINVTAKGKKPDTGAVMADGGGTTTTGGDGGTGGKKPDTGGAQA
ncbi:MAG TPA: hypothetical protein VL547_13235 [Dinghuibacter sp.]|uniref:hypothetical protein n=1 Tax=Dinghuibacter sp. TaxID=2024697 RepID=UPI002D122D2E|nr:hypothetical protein [Dinghuibacter sp.]HTJ12992.1 hypothetical protein [Dinghuibacter sp.]